MNACHKFGHKPTMYLDIRIGEYQAQYNQGFSKDSGWHGSNIKYIPASFSIYKKIGDTNNLLKHLILNSQTSSSLFDASQKITIQIKDEITEVNYMINELKKSYQNGIKESKNTVDEGKGMFEYNINHQL
jgi:hypothetical protein